MCAKTFSIRCLSRSASRSNSVQLFDSSWVDYRFDPPFKEIIKQPVGIKDLITDQGRTRDIMKKIGQHHENVALTR